MDCAEDEKYLEKLTKEREWDDWKDGLYIETFLRQNVTKTNVHGLTAIAATCNKSNFNARTYT